MGGVVPSVGADHDVAVVPSVRPEVEEGVLDSQDLPPDHRQMKSPVLLRRFPSSGYSRFAGAVPGNISEVSNIHTRCTYHLTWGLTILKVSSLES